MTLVNVPAVLCAVALACLAPLKLFHVLTAAPSRSLAR